MEMRGVKHMIRQGSRCVVGVMLVSACAALAAQRDGSATAPGSAPGHGGVSSFYTWKKRIPSTPGKLLRQEPMPENLGLANASKAVRILYSSTDGVGGKTPVALSGAVFFRKVLRRPQDGPLLPGLTARWASPMSARRRGHPARNATLIT
jgi:hypothetical protein